MRVPAVPVQFWGVITGALWFVILVVVRLLSEMPLWRHRRKEKRMRGEAKYLAQQSSGPRGFINYVLETIWAYGVAVLATCWSP